MPKKKRRRKTSRTRRSRRTTRKTASRKKPARRALGKKKAQRPQKMNRAQVDRYLRTHRDAITWLSFGVEDYIAARCCILNGLSVGYIQAAQATEQIMKAAVGFAGDHQTSRFNFRLMALAGRLREKTRIRLVAFSPILRRLERIWELKREGRLDPYSRESSKWGRSTRWLHEIDELVVFILDHLPIPEEVRFRIGLNENLLNQKKGGLLATTSTAWAMRENDPLLRNIQPLLTKHSKTLSSLDH